jgi:CHC2 zinc finger
MEAWVSFDKVRQALDLPALLAYHNITLTQRGQQFTGPCPIPGPGTDRKKTFSANAEKKGFRCFKCDAKETPSIWQSCWLGETQKTRKPCAPPRWNCNGSSCPRTYPHRNDRDSVTSNLCDCPERRGGRWRHRNDRDSVTSNLCCLFRKCR